MNHVRDDGTGGGHDRGGRRFVTVTGAAVLHAACGGSLAWGEPGTCPAALARALRTHWHVEQGFPDCAHAGYQSSRAPGPQDIVASGGVVAIGVQVPVGIDPLSLFAEPGRQPCSSGPGAGTHGGGS
jgi:hypothetical protein